jgi:hypothetical protein
MTNAQIPMTNEIPMTKGVLGPLSFVLGRWSIGHWGFWALDID